VTTSSPRGVSRCGTLSGWRRHQRADERPCDACAAAKAAYDKRWRAAPERKRRDRLKARAQGRALLRLSHHHPSEYRAMYYEALDELEAEAAAQEREATEIDDDGT